MRYLLPLLFVAVGIPLSMAPAHALDTTTQSLVITGYVTSQVTTAPFDRKLVSQARDDAAVFVASDGLILGARLEAAFASLRQHGAAQAVGDLELAQAILVQ
ncbi:MULTISPECIES: DUF2388 domain-containing protein [unclassified Pseudomonas]|jgi:uncharacterized protein (TIGR02448 family)|uniref:DUF2388 domain-containing protein n=1 Tax=unclassified Pseudomonas TaxID=196821 RepID=UPI000A0E0781|nr:MULTISPECIES: DUF2388 domain-containing protein [unclassified Pseudomonas]ATP47943.1 Holliday junction resolvase [Pseudomonas putida]SME88123.1 conserverd hypothetical protein [Pseudomonas sp. LAIL14HWK12:I11]SMR68032.1 conserverd hypothetical protein [Pseudomonas sp. LAIL14HWK12:I10]SOD00263.1 conserverd hypothetical protein [Pseudomonas sp. LAIL14HWK12:I8]